MIVRYVFIALAIVMIGIASGPSASAAQGGTYCKEQSFFTLPTWHKYLPEDTAKSDITKTCEVKFSLYEINPTTGEKTGIFDGGDLLLVGLAIIDIVTRAAGLVAFGFIVYGGFRYITSQGSPENTKAALSTIINAAIGLLVALLAAAIVSFVGYSIG